MTGDRHHYLFHCFWAPSPSAIDTIAANQSYPLTAIKENPHSPVLHIVPPALVTTSNESVRERSILTIILTTTVSQLEEEGSLNRQTLRFL